MPRETEVHSCLPGGSQLKTEETGSAAVQPPQKGGQILDWTQEIHINTYVHLVIYSCVFRYVHISMFGLYNFYVYIYICMFIHV